MPRTGWWECCMGGFAAFRRLVREARAHAERMARRDGYLVPDSVIRRAGTAPVVPFLGGGPAVLLQVPDPLVAAGVVRHSDYRSDLWRRLVRTLRTLYVIVYGTKPEAEQPGATVKAAHAQIRGVTRQSPRSLPRRWSCGSGRCGWCKSRAGRSGTSRVISACARGRCAAR
jgi:hypothetical protein